MTYLHTREAAEEYLRVREDLFLAMRTDRNNGIAADEIASTAAGTYSRPIIMEYLSSIELRDEARAALREEGLDRWVGARSTGAGRGPRAVLLALTCEPVELQVSERHTLPERLARALARAGIEPCVTDRTALAGMLFDGDEVRLRRASSQTLVSGGGCAATRNR
ncbi:hypothetical protein [Streptomyces sp. 3N207]|uniref:hypothetical protein n=1 Tax=Streptomyces sp. 3N207 TaxID=3457417 RepID=UPI003FD01138